MCKKLVEHKSDLQLSFCRLGIEFFSVFRAIEQYCAVKVGNGCVMGENERGYIVERQRT